MSTEIKLGSLNYVALMGRTCADPALKYTAKGTPVLNFRIAVDRRYKDAATGEWKSDPTFLSVTNFGQYAEKVAESLKKGSGVLVEGRLQSRSWETQTGEKRTSIEVIASRVQCLDKTQREATGTTDAPATPKSEEVDIPPDQVDDVPF